MNNQNDNIEQIRQLIFGEQMRDYQHRYEILTEEIQNLKKQMENSLDTLNKHLDRFNSDNKKSNDQIRELMDRKFDEVNNAVKNSEIRLEEKISRLKTDKTNRLQLAKYFEELAKNLKEDISEKQAKKQ